MKTCIVPRCKNTSIKNPEKIFVRVPTNPARREKWRHVLGLKKEISTNSRSCCCEDHFNLQEDAENWRYFTTLGRNISLKAHVVPHLHLGSSPPVIDLASQFTLAARERKWHNLETYAGASSSAGDEMTYEIPAKKNSRSTYTISFTPKESTTMTRSQLENSLSDLHFVGKLQPLFADIGTQVGKKHVRRKNVQVYNSPLKTKLNRRPTSATAPEEPERIRFRENRKSRMILMKMENRFQFGFPQPVYVLVTLLQICCKIRVLEILIILKKIRSKEVLSKLAGHYGIRVGCDKKIFDTFVRKIATFMQKFLPWIDNASIEDSIKKFTISRWRSS